jgi:hypothetical protein
MEKCNNEENSAHQKCNTCDLVLQHIKMILEDIRPDGVKVNKNDLIANLELIQSVLEAS